jgi:hypothetical protein
MVFQADYNPFAAIDLVASPGLHNFISRYSKSQGADNGNQGALGPAPFKRMVDGWLLSAAVAIAKGVPLVPLEAIPGDKFVTGVVLQKDIEAIEFIMLLAIAVSDDPYIVDDPRAMIKIIRQCAEAGYPYLEEMVTSGVSSEVQSISKELIAHLGAGETNLEAS